MIFLYWISTNNVIFYGDQWDSSFQFWFIIIGIILLMALCFIFKFTCLSIDSYPYFDLDSYSFILISLVIAFIGVLGIAFSIINGTLYTAVVSNPTLAEQLFEQLREQGWALLSFIVYSIFVLSVNIIFPLICRFRKESLHRRSIKIRKR